MPKLATISIKQNKRNKIDISEAPKSKEQTTTGQTLTGDAIGC
jgi:hypothetical protein